MTALDVSYRALPPDAAARLEAEQDALRAALAAARGTILDLRSHLADLAAAQDFLRRSAEVAAVSQAQERARADALLAERAGLLSERHALAARLHELEPVVQRVAVLTEERHALAARLHELEPIVQRVAVLTEERNALASRVESLDRLVRNLRWDEGPRSVRAVLPLARLMRRVSSLRR
jgi:chromosome segregation ATPase